MAGEAYLLPEGLGSQHIHRMMLSKLKILKNTIDIIDETIEAIKCTISFAKVSREAQVMIEGYKESEGNEGLVFQVGSYKPNVQEADYNDDESSEEDNNRDESSFNLRTLNLH